MKGCLLFIFILFNTGLLFSQELKPAVLSAGGGYFNNSGGSLSWTLGELMVNSYKTGEATVNQGFHQTDTKISTSIDETGFTFEIEVFPIPFTDKVTVKITGPNDKFKIEIFTLGGEQIISKRMESGILEIDMKDFPQAHYFLNVFNLDDKFLKSIKILKQ